MRIKIGDLTRITTGRLDANNASEGGRYPFFTCSSEPLKIESYSYDCECVLVAGNGDLNVKYYKGKFDAYQRTYIIESNGDGRLYVPYLYFFMRRYIKILREQAIGGVIKYIKMTNLTEVTIELPDFAKQAEIVKNLINVGGVLEKKEKQIDQLDLLVKARFVEMFGMPSHDTKGWGLKRLVECCEINPKKSDDKQLIPGLKVSFVPMAAVSENGEIDPSKTVLYDDVKSGFTYFKENDVLFAKITPCMENGKGAIAKGLTNGIGFGSTEFHVLRPISRVSNPSWIYILTTFEEFRNSAAKNMTGTAGQRRVPATFLESYEISLPPIILQNKFADFVKQVDKSKFVLMKSLCIIRLTLFCRV